MLFRGQAVGSSLAVPGRQLLFESGYSDLEEFVEVGAEDPQELEPLQQGSPGVLRFVQHSPIELQPRQFAVQKQRWMAQVA